jgi:hypothetical protein
MPATKKFILYPHAQWYFALAILITWVGFSTSYFARLRTTDIYHHIHGATVGLWIMLLIVQPILYQRGKLALHRKLGWLATIVLVPSLILGGMKMLQMMMRSADAYPPGATYTLSFFDVFGMLIFVLFFGLSIYHAKNVHTHARYMVCTVLTILPPAITRALFFIPWFNSFSKTVNGSFVAIYIVLLILVWDDKRTGNIRAPYLVAIALFALLQAGMNYAGGWAWWHQAMDWYAKPGL